MTPENYAGHGAVRHQTDAEGHANLSASVLRHRHSNPGPSHTIVAFCRGSAAEPGCWKPVPLYEFADGPHESYYQDARAESVPRIRTVGGRYQREPASAVVRPTRDRVATVLARALNPHATAGVIELEQADALLDAFWPGAVSDSQPVRPTREAGETRDLLASVLATLADYGIGPGDTADALLEQFHIRLLTESEFLDEPGVAVSDSQETRE